LNEVSRKRTASVRVDLQLAPRAAAIISSLGWIELEDFQLGSASEARMNDSGALTHDLDSGLQTDVPGPHLPLLLVEDEPLQLEILAQMLTRAGFAVKAVANGQDALIEVRSGAYSLVVTDRSMPGLDGLQLCRAIRAAQLPTYVYILMLTGLDSTTDAVAGLKAGADDYVSKPAREEELIARLAAGCRILTLEQSLRAANERIRLLTVTDALVGTFNRRYFDDQLHAAVARAERYHRPLSLVFVDLDHFKLINDTHGHRVGDQVLIEVGRRLLASLRADDWISRYGGEEFAVVLPETAAEAAAGVAERLRTAIADQKVPTDAGDLTVTASFGVASSLPSTAMTPEALIGAADTALYRSKADGRNRTTSFRG
jgi:diguanylate cyclase (GGDEF)-like protein